MTSFFAVTTRGLEFVSAAEIARLEGALSVEQGYRRISFAYRELPLPLLRLRTVDDVFVSVATWQSIARPRATLNLLQRLSEALDLEAAADVCAAIRPVSGRPRFSVTASFVGKRNYNTDEIKLSVAAGIEAGHDWRYEPNDALAEINVRLFIEHEIASVGVRLADRALHERPYKQAHLTGSLKPPVAAALLSLARIAPGVTVLDPCCGVGTILIEAALAGAQASGGDHDADTVTAARLNSAGANVEVGLEQWDARRLPLADGSIDRIVSNLPWGRQIATDADLHSFYRDAISEMRRVLTSDGQIVLLTGTPDLIDPSGLRCDQQFEISLFGQTPTVSVLSKLP
jgi:23S rRNA G2445 N2-methylase RlmL